MSENYPDPSFKIDVNGKVYKTITDQAKRLGQTTKGYATALFLAAYSARCGNEGDPTLSKAVNDAFAKNNDNELRQSMRELSAKLESSATREKSLKDKIETLETLCKEQSSQLADERRLNTEWKSKAKLQEATIDELRTRVQKHAGEVGSARRAKNDSERKFEREMGDAKASLEVANDEIKRLRDLWKHLLPGRIYQIEADGKATEIGAHGGGKHSFSTDVKAVETFGGGGSGLAAEDMTIKFSADSKAIPPSFYGLERREASLPEMSSIMIDNRSYISVDPVRCESELIKYEEKNFEFARAARLTDLLQGKDKEIDRLNSELKAIDDIISAWKGKAS